MYTISKMFGFKGGVEVEHRKNTNEIEALKMPVPPKVLGRYFLVYREL